MGSDLRIDGDVPIGEFVSRLNMFLLRLAEPIYISWECIN